MDNMKYYNDSLAYDFDMFMPKTASAPRKQDNIVKLPDTNAKKRVVRKAISRKVSVSVSAVVAAAFILAAMCGNIFLRLQINEVNSEINTVKNEMDLLNSVKVGLEVEFERRISYSNIELEAAQLGMQKMDKDQVTYIRVNDINTAKTYNGQIVSESVENTAK